MLNIKNRTFGYLFDFWVYVVGKLAGENTEHGRKFEYGKLSCRVCVYTGPSSFAFPICDSSGVYYNVLSSCEEEGGTVFIKEKTQSDEHYFRVPWKTKEEIDDVKPIIIDSEYKEEIIKLLRFLISESPVKKLYVQIRRQGLERDNIIGMITLKQFAEMMDNDELLGNMVYVIHE